MCEETRISDSYSDVRNKEWLSFFHSGKSHSIVLLIYVNNFAWTSQWKRILTDRSEYKKNLERVEIEH